MTWGSGITGVSGVVSSSNSLVGSTEGDAVGQYGGVIALSNGNYVVRTLYWNNGAVSSVGAVTWGDGTTGTSGTISSSNSLIGGAAGDAVGSGGVVAVGNGNYLVVSPEWDSGGVANVGAVTWCDGSTGTSGTISSSNSLVGSASYDRLGKLQDDSSGVTVLSNGSYLVRCVTWNSSRGAATWGSGNSGVSGVVSSSNSLVGAKDSDSVGSGGVIALNNGNYVVLSSICDNGLLDSAGAVTWGSGTTGVSGVVSSSNSLMGAKTDDRVGNGGVLALGNGNYVVRSTLWDHGAVTDAGAATWGSGTTGISGVVSSSNSLVGSTANDQVGSHSISALTNGSYVVSSPIWDNGTVINAGAVTWGSGTTGVSGAVSSSNSLVGSTNTDQIGSNGVTALTNGNYVVRSTVWDNGAVVNAGAATWGSGTTGVSGTISSSNSLVGSIANDSVASPGITALKNGNYVVRTTGWDNGAATSAGAATWGDGTTGITGTISSSNSLVGSTANDRVGEGGVMLLSNGNYVVISQNWDNGTITNAGAATWGNGSTGVSGVVSSSNSLVGGTAGNNVGNGGVTELSNGNMVVRSHGWDNAGVTNVGAVTWGSVNGGVTGVVSSSNSLVGATASELLSSNGGVTPLSNGNYVVISYGWNNGSVSDAGAVAWGSGTSGVTGEVSSNNSLVGQSSMSLGEVFFDEVNNTFMASFPGEATGRVRVGSLVDGLVPNLLTVTPATGSDAGGNSITLTGRGFTGATAVTFDGTPAISFTVVNYNTLTVTVPAHAVGTVNVAVTTPQGTSVGSSLYTYTYTVSPQMQFDDAMTAAGLSGPDALATATLRQDGVANLLKYAFNMDLTAPDRRTLVPGSGIAGLPVITLPSPGVMRVEYVRRIGSGLVYSPRKRSALDAGAWTPLTALPQLTPMDTNWERIHHDEPFNPVTTPVMFGSVEVTLP